MKKISRWDLIRTMYRSLYLHAVWNFERMQNVGFLYAMIPAIQKLYPEKEKRVQALKRHLEFFNTHPYMASPLIGVVTSMEERMANGENVKPEDIVAVKSTMAGPLAALGDSLFWASIRPFAGLLGVSIIIWGEGTMKLLGPIFFLLFYNGFHFHMRLVGLIQGYRMETRVIEMIKKIDAQRIIELTHLLGLIVLGAVVVFMAYQFPPIKGAFFFGLIIVLLAAMRKRLSNTVLLYFIVLVSLLIKYINK
ncbi:MAG: PTS system mannose/fructose/sorbose family transporter subunit IID [bacterium]